MLIDFTFKNYLSFKDEVSISFEALGFKGKPENYKKLGSKKILKSLAVYGSNASGKSNLIKALEFATSFIVNSSSKPPTSLIQQLPYLLDDTSDQCASDFEFIFSLGNKSTIYRYSFSVNKFAVLNEEFGYFDANNDEYNMVFDRNQQKIISFDKSLKDIADRTRVNSLFISSLAQWNNKIALKVVDFFDNFIFIDNDLNKLFITNNEVINLLSDNFINLIKSADLGIESIKSDKEKNNLSINLPDEMPEPLKELIMAGKIKRVPDSRVEHSRYNKDKEKIGNVEFSLRHNESDGTQKYISCLPLLLRAIAVGGVLIVDELENYLHPLLSRMIIELFFIKELNKSAQLLLTTHDTSLIDANIFRKDQIYIVDKDKYGASYIDSISDFEDFENVKQKELSLYYLKGKFGGIPNIKKPNFSKKEF